MKSSVKNKAIWLIAYPIIFGNLAQTLITLTDTAFLGRVSNIALGASMMAGIYYYVYSTLAWGFAIGIQIIVARRLGEKRLERIGVIFEHGLVFVLSLSILLFLIQHFCTAGILEKIIQSPNIYAAAMEYMDYRHYGIIFVCFNFLFRALYIGLSNTKVISFSTALMAAVNIFLDYALIFGKLGFPEMGIGGAALASVCAEISALIFFTGYTIIKLPLKTYMLFYFHKLEGWLMVSILKLAFPTMIQKLLSFGTVTKYQSAFSVFLCSHREPEPFTSGAISSCSKASAKVIPEMIRPFPICRIPVSDVFPHIFFMVLSNLFCASFPPESVASPDGASPTTVAPS